MANQCPDCNADVLDAQIALRANPMGSTEDTEEWPTFTAHAEVCSKCGRMRLYMTKPKTFGKWLGSEKQRLAQG